MSLKIVGLTETFAAYLTSMRFFASVNLHVRR